MCVTSVSDISCHTQGCENIVVFSGHEEHEPCPRVTRNKWKYGGCGSPIRQPSGYSVRAEKSICNDCKARAKREQKERYDNAPKHIDDLREKQQRRDHEGHVRRGEPVRSGTPMPQAQPASQQAYGAGTQWSADPEDYMYGGQEGFMYSFGDPKEYFGLETGVGSFPQGLDLEDPGEGPSGSSDYQYNQGYGEGHDRQGGQGSGGQSRR